MFRKPKAEGRRPKLESCWRSSFGFRPAAFFRSSDYRFRTSPGSSAAFTLIELMMVMLLIGILSAMILPEMKGTYGDALLRASARDLVNAISIASSRAISLNQLQAVRIDAKTGHYELQRQVPALGKSPEFVPVKDVPESSGEVDSRITVEVHKGNQETDNTTATAGEGEKPDRGETAPPAEREDSQSAPDLVSFYPDGTADAAEILLRDRAGFGVRLRINPITARVEIADLERE